MDQLINVSIKPNVAEIKLITIRIYKGNYEINHGATTKMCGHIYGMSEFENFDHIHEEVQGLIFVLKLKKLGQLHNIIQIHNSVLRD